MKTKYILHGGYTQEDNAENIKFYTECFTDTPKQAQILVVLFAKEDNISEEYYQNFCDILQKFTNENVQFKKADEETFISQARQADIIFFQGGNTNMLLEKLRKYSDLPDTFEGKTIVGSSAGAYALSTLGASHHEAHTREGLGILPLRVVCHYESDRLAPSKTSLTEIRNTREDLELVLLRDYEYRIFEK